MLQVGQQLRLEVVVAVVQEVVMVLVQMEVMVQVIRHLQVHQQQQLHAYKLTLVSIQFIHQYLNQLQQWLKIIGKNEFAL